MHDVFKLILDCIGIIGFTAIIGLLYIHFFIKIPKLLEHGQRPTFWGSFFSPFAQRKDFSRFLDLSTKSQDSYFQYVLRIEKIFIYILITVAGCLILMMLFFD